MIRAYLQLITDEFVRDYDPRWRLIDALFFGGFLFFVTVIIVGYFRGFW